MEQSPRRIASGEPVTEFAPDATAPEVADVADVSDVSDVPDVPDVIEVAVRAAAGQPLPTYAHPLDAGADLHAAEDVELAPGQRALVGTGLAVALPAGYVGLVHPRSGLAARLGVTVLNAPGTVDAGYRGEIRVNLINHDPARTAVIRRGDRIAQLVVQRVAHVVFRRVDALPDSSRGTGGHGSTGGHAGLPIGGHAGVPAAVTAADAVVPGAVAGAATVPGESGPTRAQDAPPGAAPTLGTVPRNGKADQ
jgi:dUTP pyrophosphatase